MKETSVTFKYLPAVLSFQRGILNTDALMYDEIGGNLFPLWVTRHGIRGTQNVVDTKDEATSVKSAARNVSNIQIIESAKTSPDADALVVQFGIRMLDLSNALFACAGSAKDTDTSIAPRFRASIKAFTAQAKTSIGLTEVSNRYARNILNGRWLWRNRAMAETVDITVMHGDVEIAKSNAFDVPMNTFGDYTEAEKTIGALLCAGLQGEFGTGISVSARLTFGIKGAIEVHPSENSVEKVKGFGRSLYKLGVPEKAGPLDIAKVGHAAMRDHKLGNAFRTIDTWYPDYEEVGRPIPIEPNGASLELMNFMRNSKTSSFTLFKRLAELAPGSDDEMFCIGALIRGGVYSEGNKPAEPPKPKKGGSAQPESDE